MTQPAGDLLLKILKYFEAMFNIFEFFHVKEIVQSWLVYGITCRESFNMFLEKDNEIKLVPVSFSDVLELL